MEKTCYLSSTLNNLIEINFTKADVYYQRGAAKAVNKDYKGAISDYSKALKLIPLMLIFTTSGAMQESVSKITKVQ